VNRRDFLKLGRRGHERVLEISGERLYMRWVDAAGRTARMDAIADPAGEPPTRVVTETAEDLLAELDRRLADADALRVTGEEWLQDSRLKREVETRVAAFHRRKGGKAKAVILALAICALAAAPVTAQATPDAALRARVEAALAAAADLPADSLTVAVQGGVVTLSGSVICEECGGNATPPGAGTVQQSLGAVVRAVPGVSELRFALRYRPPN
jgi:hypothetical protein